MGVTELGTVGSEERRGSSCLSYTQNLDLHSQFNRAMPKDRRDLLTHVSCHINIGSQPVARLAPGRCRSFRGMRLQPAEMLCLRIHLETSFAPPKT